MKASEAITLAPKTSKVSKMVLAMQEISEQIITERVGGQFGHSVKIKTGYVTIDNSELDFEFTVPFDDDTTANETEITIYNLSDATINRIEVNKSITIEAGYGSDTGIIFSGFISAKRTKYEGLDKITTIYALDSFSLTERKLANISYAAGTSASYILRSLVGMVGLPIAVFKTNRDYVYTDEVKLDSGLMENIKRLAKICGVSAYICKSKIYVRSLKDGDNIRFSLSADTGLLSVSEFEEEEENEGYKDVVKGFEVECLLQHRIQTASIIDLESKNYKGRFRVREGEHSYNGTDFITKVKVVSYNEAYVPVTSSNKTTVSSEAQTQPTQPTTQPTQPTTQPTQPETQPPNTNQPETNETIYVLKDKNGYVLTDSENKIIQLPKPIYLLSDKDGYALLDSENNMIKLP